MRRTAVRKRLSIIAVVLVAGCIATAAWFLYSIDDLRVKHVVLAKPTGVIVLSESEALELATKALTMTWPDVKQWKPVSDNRVDGRTFVSESSTCGRITFDTQPRAWSVTVRLTVRQNEVACDVIRLK